MHLLVEDEVVRWSREFSQLPLTGFELVYRIVEHSYFQGQKHDPAQVPWRQTLHEFADQMTRMMNNKWEGKQQPGTYIMQQCISKDKRIMIRYKFAS